MQNLKRAPELLRGLEQEIKERCEKNRETDISTAAHILGMWFQIWHLNNSSN